MNIRALANAATSRISPNMSIIWRQNMGAVQDMKTGKRSANWQDTVLVGQVQALTSHDLRHIEGLNQQAYTRAVYLNAQAMGARRSEMKGGDLFLFNGQTWKVISVPENWPLNGWGKVIVALRQTDEQYPD